MSITKKQLLKLFELVGAHKLQPQAALDIALGRVPFPEEPAIVIRPAAKKLSIIKPIVVDTRPEVVKISPTIDKEYPIVVDYSKSLKEMIDAGGYDYIDPYIKQKNLPINSVGRVSMSAIVVCYDHELSNNDMLADLDRRNLRLATTAELLSFGATYPDEQRKHSIVAIGSAWSSHDGIYIACLWEDDSHDRVLDVEEFDVWDPTSCFLAVRKDKA